jgi:hypothetical protein
LRYIASAKAATLSLTVNSSPQIRVPRMRSVQVGLRGTQSAVENDHTFRGYPPDLPAFTVAFGAKAVPK